MSSFVSFIRVLLTITFPEMEDFSTFGITLALDVADAASSRYLLPCILLWVWPAFSAFSLVQSLVYPSSFAFFLESSVSAFFLVSSVIAFFLVSSVTFLAFGFNNNLGDCL